MGETLTVDTSGIDDADGIGNATFSYQWIAGTTDISGATGSSYAPLVADLDKTIKVRVSFDDDRNFPETLTSEATATVIAAVTPLTAKFRDAPDKHLGTGDFTFEIAFSEPISIGYKTLRDDSLDVTNGSATKAKRVNGQSDLWKITVEPDSDADVTVVLPITSDCGTQGAVCSRAGGNKRRPLSNRSELTVPGPAAANSPATGAPRISGTAQAGETLTVDTSGIDDADGMSGAVYSYQWLANGADVAGATSDTYTPVADDVGKAIKVKVSFRDDRNHQESLTSEATAAVEAAAVESSIWTSTLTVKRWGTSTNRLFGFDALVERGELDPPGFSHDGVEYQIEILFFQEKTRQLHFATYSDLAAGSYLLNLDGIPFQFEASGTEEKFSFSKAGLKWRNGDEVEVILTLAD